MPNSLVVSDLRKTFLSPTGEKIELLRGISFSATGGEIAAIRGASGAGKSTLLHLLGGLEAADSGLIQLDGFNLSSARPSVIASFLNDQIGFVFQFHYLLPDLTAIENVALPLMIARCGRAESLSRAREALAKIGLGDRLQHRVGHLSGGEAQRVAVVRALITEPTLVLADEPTGNLDVSIGDEIGDALVRYSRQQHSVVLVATHNERLARLCDRELLLANGRVGENEKTQF